jgi:hypothetical protein
VIIRGSLRRHAGESCTDPLLITKKERAQSSRDRMWTFWSSPMAIRLANIEEPP